MASSSHIQEFKRIFFQDRENPVANSTAKNEEQVEEISAATRPRRRQVRFPSPIEEDPENPVPKSTSETTKNEDQIDVISAAAPPPRAPFPPSIEAQAATSATVPHEPDNILHDKDFASEDSDDRDLLFPSLQSAKARYASLQDTDEDYWNPFIPGSAKEWYPKSSLNGEPAITVTVNSELKAAVAKLSSKLNIRIPPQSLTSSTETGSFRLAGRLIRILRGELKTASSATETSEGLRESIEKIIDDVIPRGTLKMKHPSVFPESPEAHHEREIKARVEFSQLREVFLPGELIYVERSELATEDARGQCWRVDDCAYTDSETSRFLWIKTLEWKWNGSSWNFRLIEGQIYIEEYTGRISFEELGVVPMARMETSDKAAVQERLISRGKVYMDLFMSKQSLWEYHGPVTRDVSPYKWFSRPMAPEISGLGDKTLTRTKQYSKMKSQAMVSIVMPQISRGEEPTDFVMDTSEPLHGETYMIFSRCVWAQLVTSICAPLTMIHLNYLSPVKWKVSNLDARDDRTCAQILSALRAAQPSIKAHASPGLNLERLIVIVYGDTVRISLIMEAVAASDQRSSLELDLLDLPQMEADRLFEFLESRLAMAAGLRGLMVLHNFAPLVARRSFDDPERCEEITRFINFLEIFSGTVILCLDRNDIVDGKLRKLRPVYVDIDNDGKG